MSAWRHDWARLASAAVLAQLVPLLVLPWLTRSLPTEDIGRWSLFAALAANFAIVACLRYEYALVLPRSTGGARSLLGLCLALAVAWGGLLAIGVAVAWLVWPDGAARLGSVWLWLPPAVTLAGAIQALTLWHNRGGRFEVISRARVANPATAAAAQASGAAAGWAAWLSGAHLLCGGQVLGQAAGAFWLGWKARADLARLRTPTRWRWQRRRWWVLARRYRQFPLVNTPHAFVNGLQDTVALALVLASAGPAAAGFFGLMVRVVMAPTSLVGGALSEVLLGRAAQTWREGGDLVPTIRRSVRILTLFAVPSALVLVLAGPSLFALVFGPAWREAGEWARWLAPCMAGRMIVGPLTVLPMILERQATAFAFSLCGNALYVLALWVGLAWGGLEVACAAVSLVMSGYFLAFGGWLVRAARVAHAARTAERPVLQESRT
jgi:O-antigen/teichoic acid export membrane protein